MRPRMDRWAAADLLRELTSERFGSVEQAVAAGLALRHDGGPCFRADHDQTEIDHLEIARSPAYHYEPEPGGCIEKFIQTLKDKSCGSHASSRSMRHATAPHAKRAST